MMIATTMLRWTMVAMGGGGGEHPGFCVEGGLGKVVGGEVAIERRRIGGQSKNVFVVRRWRLSRARDKS